MKFKRQGESPRVEVDSWEQQQSRFRNVRWKRSWLRIKAGRNSACQVPATGFKSVQPISPLIFGPFR